MGLMPTKASVWSVAVPLGATVPLATNMSTRFVRGNQSKELCVAVRCAAGCDVAPAE